MDSAQIEAAILALLDERAAGKTICPSEVARHLAGEDGAWRALMPDIRHVADGLASVGRLRVTQRGVEVTAEGAVGPIRLGRPYLCDRAALLQAAAMSANSSPARMPHDLMQECSIEPASRSPRLEHHIDGGVTQISRPSRKPG